MRMFDIKLIARYIALSKAEEKMGYDLETLTAKDSLSKIYADHEVFATPLELRDYIFPPEKMDK